jgi:hypothetical protein
VSGNLYSLSVEVRDPSNAVADGGTMALHRVEIVEPGTILFVDTRNGGNPELYTMNTDGTNEMRLSRSPGFDESWPQLSPDGARVMYVRRPTGPDVGGGVLMTVGIDGQNPKRVLQPSDLPPHPGPIHPVESIVGSCWSPDGSQVAVIARYGGPTGGLDIYVCDADGSSPTRAHSATAGLSVTSASKVTWHWDPPYDRGDMDRQRLIFTSPYDSRYFTFYLDGRTEMAHNGRVITDINAGPSGDVAWVEGGRLMVGDFDPVSGLSAGTSIGGGLTNIAGPAWSPSGHRLVFSGQATGPNIRLYRVDAGGANQVRLTNTATALEASWGP